MPLVCLEYWDDWTTSSRNGLGSGWLGVLLMLMIGLLWL